MRLGQLQQLQHNNYKRNTQSLNFPERWEIEKDRSFVELFKSFHFLKVLPQMTVEVFKLLHNTSFQSKILQNLQLSYHFTRFPFAYAFNIYMADIWQGMHSSILHRKPQNHHVLNGSKNNKTHDRKNCAPRSNKHIHMIFLKGNECSNHRIQIMVESMSFGSKQYSFNA